LILHVAFLFVAGACFVAGWWQVHRAMDGNTLSYLYSIEWPGFAVVAGIGWWQMIHDTPEDIASRKAHHARMRAASAAVVARTLPRSAMAITVASEEVASDPALSAGNRTTPATWELGDGSEHRSADLAVSDQALLVTDHDAEDVDELTQYNRYLALLAVRGKPKTWRNPRGV
jgi:hypothetical protein